MTRKRSLLKISTTNRTKKDCNNLKAESVVLLKQECVSHSRSMDCNTDVCYDSHDWASRACI